MGRYIPSMQTGVGLNQSQSRMVASVNVGDDEDVVAHIGHAMRVIDITGHRVVAGLS